MIDVMLTDGSIRKLDQAEVTMTWQDSGETGDLSEKRYTLDEVKAMVVYSPNLKTMAGMFRGMPVMGMAFETDFRIEVPMPLGFANDLGMQLTKDTDRYAAQVKAASGNAKVALQRYMALPADTPPPPG